MILSICILNVAPLIVDATESSDNFVGVSSGTTGDCTWTLDDNGTLTIGGGKKLGFYYDNWNGQPWYSFRYKIKSVVIEEGVTFTGCRAFFDCYNLTSVSLPTSLENIGGFTFERCSRLNNLTIPEKVENIGYYAFYNTALWNAQTGPVYVDNCLVGYNGTAASKTTLQIKDGTKLIANDALIAQKGISNIIIPDSVKFINVGAFDDTGWYLNQPDGLLYLDNYLVGTKGRFDSSNQIVIKERTKFIAGDIFYDHSENNCNVFTTAYLPKSVKCINGYAFEDCVNLSDVYYSGNEDEWKQIQIGLKGNDYLTSANIHYNYTYVKNEVFKDNSTLTLLKNAQKSGKSILNDYDAGDTAKVIAFDVLTNLFDLAAEQLTVDFGGDTPEEKALDEVTQNIMKDYFGYNGSIEEQKLNSINEKWNCFKTAVKGIKKLRAQKKEAEAKKLAKTTIKQISKKGDTFGDKVINGFSKISPYIDGAFTYYEIAMTAAMLQEFDKATVESLINTFPKNTTAYTGLQRLYHDMTISPDQYIIEKFTQATIISALSDFLEEITFQGNEGLKEAYSSASGILSLAYELSGGVTMKDISRARSAEAIASNALSLLVSNSDSGKREMLFNFCLSSIKVELENCIKVCKSSSTALKSSAQDYLGKVNKLTYEKYIKNCANEYNNPQDVTFENPDLEKYKISAKNASNNKALSPVGANDDETLTNENELIIPSSTEDYLVTSISENGFANLEGITTIYVPNSIEEIGDSAFYNCVDTQSITLGNKVTLIGEKAFMNCSNLSSINLNANLKTIKASAFENCSNLTSAVLGKELSVLGDKAFANCESLSTVFVFNPTLVIPDAAFENCGNLTIYGYTGSTAEEYANHHNIQFENIGDSASEIKVNYNGEPTVELYGSVNADNISLDITYSDGKTETVTDGLAIACDTSSVGKKNAVVICGSAYTTFEVDVVNSVPTEISFDNQSYNMVIGDRIVPNVTILPESRDFQVTLTSSDESVVEIEGDSIVAVGEGNAEITALTVDGNLSTNCSVSVGNNQSIDCSDGLFDPVFFIAPADGKYSFSVESNDATVTMHDSAGRALEREEKSQNGVLNFVEELIKDEVYLLFVSSVNCGDLLINKDSTTTAPRSVINSLSISLEGFEFYDDEYINNVLANTRATLIVNGEECHNDGAGSFVGKHYTVKIADYQVVEQQSEFSEQPDIKVTLYFNQSGYDWEVEKQISFCLEYWSVSPQPYSEGKAEFVKKPNVISNELAGNMDGAELLVSLDIPEDDISINRTIVFGKDCELEMDSESGECSANYTFGGFEEGTYHIWINNGTEEYFQMVVVLEATDSEIYYIDESFYNKNTFKNAFDEDVLIGDVNGDGSITIDDATTVQKAIAEIIVLNEDQKNAADANGDGYISIDDATTIQKYIAEMIDYLGK